VASPTLGAEPTAEEHALRASRETVTRRGRTTIGGGRGPVDPSEHDSRSARVGRPGGNPRHWIDPRRVASVSSRGREGARDARQREHWDDDMGRTTRPARPHAPRVRVVTR
jgi:hypothetical protein